MNNDHIDSRKKTMINISLIQRLAGNHKTSFLVVALVAAPALCLSGYQEKLEEAYEYMYTDYEKAITLTRNILSENPSELKALWIKSIACTNLGDMQSSKKKQGLYYEKADKLANKALEVDSKSPNANHAKAIVLGRMAENAGVREALRLSRQVKKYSDRVLALDEEHGGAWFVRGMLMYRIDTLSRIERWIANSLFGGLPFEADRDAAVAALGRAVELDSDNIYFHLEYGKVLKEYGQIEEAKQILESALDLEALNPKDEDYLNEAKELIDRL